MKRVFEAVQLGNLSMKNRLVRSATWEGIARPDGSVTEEAYAIYDELASGGVGAIITGFTSVALHDYYFGGMMRLCDEALIPQYKRLTDIIHTHGTPVITQLALGAYYREVNGQYRQVEPDDMTADEINMEGFHLFDTEHRSSKPLCLAYKAAQLAAPDKADVFLTALRHATVLECRPTTHKEEILCVVRKVGIEEESFSRYFRDGSAEAALEQDLAFTHSLGIRSLPTYLLQYRDQALMLRSFDYQDFDRAITRLTADRI